MSIDFFLDPYQNSSWLNILLEFVAAVFGITSVFLAKKENTLVYPVGLVSTLIYVYLLVQWQLFGDLIINIYYSFMSVYGWYMWTRVKTDTNESLQISRMNFTDKLKAFGIFLFSSAFIIFVYRHYNVISTEMGFIDSFYFVVDQIGKGSLEEFKKITPYLDTFTTGAAFVAMWLMANKKIENWTFWIAVNLVSVPLYFVKGFGFTGIQYFVFLILAIYGYLEWKKRIIKTT